MTDFGTDISCTDDLDPLAQDISGPALMAQALLRRVITRQGMLLDDPLYGLGLLDLLNEETTDNELTIIASKMKTELEKDERVIRVAVIASRVDDAFNFEINAFGADGPFSLTLASDGVTVELLKVGV